jgi:hypothetical protein
MNNNPVRYTDPTGHSVDGGCHGAGFNCEDYTWSRNDWEEHGVTFSGDNWGYQNRIGGAVSALNRVREVLGYSRMASLAGLGGEGGLTLVSYSDNASFRRTSGCSGDSSCYDHTTNSIQYAPGTSSTTWVHEIGHAVDWHAGDGNNFFSTGSPAGTGEWVENVGWSFHGDDDWSLNPSSVNGATTQYALENPREDFAETFTWYIYSQTGGAPQGYNEPNIDRQTYLYFALNR